MINRVCGWGVFNTNQCRMRKLRYLSDQRQSSDHLLFLFHRAASNPRELV